MEEKEKPARAGIASRLREADKKHFNLHRFHLQALYPRYTALVMRDSSSCPCPFHYVQFNYYYN